MKIIIGVEEFKMEFQKEFHRLEQNLSDQIKEMENNGFIIKDLEEIKIKITDAAIVNAIICLISRQGLIILKSVEKQKQKLFWYYFKLITSHARFFEDFEYYNIALILRYLLETVAGIIMKKNNLENHFKSLNKNEYEKRLNYYNRGIKNSIEKTLGSNFGEIYKKISAYAHPMKGPLFGLEPKVVSKRNIDIIKWSIKVYIKTSKEIFKILGHNLIINFENFIYDSINKVLKEINLSEII